MFGARVFFRGVLQGRLRPFTSSTFQGRCTQVGRLLVLRWNASATAAAANGNDGRHGPFLSSFFRSLVPAAATREGFKSRQFTAREPFTADSNRQVSAALSVGEAQLEEGKAPRERVRAPWLAFCTRAPSPSFCDTPGHGTKHTFEGYGMSPPPLFRLPPSLLPPCCRPRYLM